MKLSEEPIETKQKNATFEDGQKIKFTKSGLINNPNAFEVSDNPFGDDGQNQLQYCGVYSARYQAIKPQLEEAVAIKYPTTTTKKLNELRFGDNVIVMGTVIKVYKNQPSILKTIAAGDVDMNEGMKQEDKAGKKYCDDDEIFLEDETQE